MSKTIYFLGIGGIGMSALARYFLRRGDRVYGYDHVASAITQQLQQEGAIIHFDDDVSQIPEHVDEVVYTPAIPHDHSELSYFQIGFQFATSEDGLCKLGNGIEKQLAGIYDDTS